jgi:hypothetical protein
LPLLIKKPDRSISHLLPVKKWPTYIQRYLDLTLIKVSKSQKHFSELSILPKKEWETEKNILRAVRIYFFLFGFFGRFENSKNCFQDLLTFNTKKIELKTYLVHQVYPEVNLSSRGS